MRNLGYIGLGKMGFNMVERLLEKKHHVAAFDKNREAVQSIATLGAAPSDSLEDVAAVLKHPRLVWIMVPYKAVDAVLTELTPHLEKGDTVIDGGNSPYKDSIRRAAELESRGIDFLDAGVSGGPEGARAGACIMVGGKREAFRRCESLFADLSAENGYAYLGPSGSGHFVKMVHNGIEYGMMQALAEGFTLLKASPFALDLARTADLYNRRSVIESRLVEWLREAYERYGADLEEISGSPEQSGEGAWTVQTAREWGIPAPVIEASLEFRLRSRENPGYIGRIITVLRHQFGGHDV
jgi:6-phosphogluconate dehydrogenase